MLEVLYRNATFFIRENGHVYPMDLSQVAQRFGVQFAEAAVGADAWIEFDDDPRAGGDAPPDLSVDEADEAMAQLLPDHNTCVNLNRWRHASTGKRAEEWTISILGFAGEAIVSFEAPMLHLAVELAREHVQRSIAAVVPQVNAA